MAEQSYGIDADFVTARMGTVAQSIATGAPLSSDDLQELIDTAAGRVNGILISAYSPETPDLIAAGTQRTALTNARSLVWVLLRPEVISAIQGESALSQELDLLRALAEGRLARFEEKPGTLGWTGSELKTPAIQTSTNLLGLHTDDTSRAARRKYDGSKLRNGVDDHFRW